MPFCRIPFTGITINPQGKIVMCCSAAHYTLADMDDVPDLQEWFNNNQQLADARLQMVRYKEMPDQCVSCFRWQTEDVPMTRWVRDLVEWDDETFNLPELPITFLEVTTSNTCNQTCTMCNSFFSSKWVNLEHKALKQGLEFRRDSRYPDIAPKQRLSDENVDKLIAILPTVRTLVLKGGEPFADPSNMRILKAASELPDPPLVMTVTNGSFLSDEQEQLLRTYRGRLNISLSYDGIGDVYHWVRSTKFDRTQQVAERFMDIKRRREAETILSIDMSVSLYTAFQLVEAVHHWVKYDQVSGVFLKPVIRPVYSAIGMLPQPTVDKLMLDWKQLASIPTVRFHSTMHTLSSYSVSKPSLYLQQIRNVAPWIDFMNKQRGFRLQDVDQGVANYLLSLEK